MNLEIYEKVWFRIFFYARICYFNLEWHHNCASVVSGAHGLKDQASTWTRASLWGPSERLGRVYGGKLGRAPTSAEVGSKPILLGNTSSNYLYHSKLAHKYSHIWTPKRSENWHWPPKAKTDDQYDVQNWCWVWNYLVNFFFFMLLVKINMLYESSRR